MSDSDLLLRVECLRREADQVISLTLADPKGRRLPDWEPGAHVQLHLPSGRTRQYSLFAGGREGTQYKIAVKDVEGGRGGSREVHSTIKLGDVLKIGAPANKFPLEKGQDYIFIAGGIGITPILPMAEAVCDSSSWHLYYAGRSTGSMGLMDEVRKLPQGNVTLAPGDTGERIHLRDIVSGATRGTYIYACGPAEMLEELDGLCAERQDIYLRTERFSAPTKPVAVDASSDKAFEVVLKRSGRRVVVPPGSTVLAELLKIDPAIPFSCCEGYCGTCETKVLEGEVDHRDSLLSEEERRRNNTMLICASRALSDVLVLDI